MINIEHKFTRSMEEILLSLLVLCILQNKWEGKGFTKQIQAFTGKNSKTIGSSLQKLADFGYIKYEQKGRGKQIIINVEDDFIQSMLITIFGLKENYKANLLYFDKKTFNGFIPANLDFDHRAELLKDKLLEIDAEIKAYKEYIDWVNSNLQWASEAKGIDFSKPIEIESNLIYQFSENLVSTFEHEKINHVNGLTIPILRKIILQKIKASFESLPWLCQNTITNMRVDEI